MYSIDLLAGLQSHLYQNMTFPAYRAQLHSLDSATGVVAVGASESGQPVGLALAQFDSERSAQVLSLYVAPAHRNRGLGRLLLQRIDSALAGMSCASALVVYNREGKYRSALERILAVCGWPDASPRVLICKANGQILKADWFAKSRLPKGASIFSWRDITDEERRSIYERQQVSPWVPDDLLPEAHEPGMQELNSVGLRHQGEVVGWVITHWVAPSLYRYTCSFVRQDLQRRLAVVPLYREAINRQAAVEGLESIGMWTVPLRHAGMAEFVKRRMAPHLVSLDVSMGTTKSNA
jgi:GNAT superfamily N-acetyltransferase